MYEDQDEAPAQGVAINPELWIAPLEPGRRYDVRIPLDAIAHAVAPGHRLRLAVSTVYWPWAWPSPEPVTLTLHGGRLRLPLRAPRDDHQPEFGPPEQIMTDETLTRVFDTPVTCHDGPHGRLAIYY